MSLKKYNLFTMENKKLENTIQAGVIGLPENFSLIKQNNIFGKPVLLMDGVKNKDIAKAYWQLDGNAFGNMSAPKFMKMDALVLSGPATGLFMPNEMADEDLKSLMGKDLEYYPIGFMDLHKITEGKFVCSGLGIAQAYQGKGLSKYLIYAGVSISGAKELIMPTQLKNNAAHYAWSHLSNISVISKFPFHDEADTIVYKAVINDPENILLGKNYDFLEEYKKNKTMYENYEKEQKGVNGTVMISGKEYPLYPGGKHVVWPGTLHK